MRTAALLLLFCNEGFASRHVFGDEWLLGTRDTLFDISPIFLRDLRGPIHVLDPSLH
jgi:hypothetical protein